MLLYILKEMFSSHVMINCA